MIWKRKFPVEEKTLKVSFAGNRHGKPRLSPNQSEGKLGKPLGSDERYDFGAGRIPLEEKTLKVSFAGNRHGKLRLFAKQSEGKLRKPLGSDERYD